MKLLDLIFNYFAKKNARDPVTVTTDDAREAYIDYSLRRLAFDTCVNLIANAIGNCEFQTLERGKPKMAAEYFTLNVEPNGAQNSSAFWHEFIYKLYLTNEVLVISRPTPKGLEELIIADSYTCSETWPERENTYSDITVRNHTFRKTFGEEDVLHVVLNNKNIRNIVDMIYASYSQLISTAEAAYSWREGQHIKVHVDHMAGGAEGFQDTFYKMLNDQVRPWMNNPNSVLPEFDGYKYELFGDKQGGSTRDIKALYDDIFDYTARAFGIPPVLVKGDVADSKDAFSRWLTTGIDPLAEQIQEEINRKRYGLHYWKKETRVHINTSTLIHFDLFSNSASIEKLVGSAAFSINDILTAAGYARITEEWADAHYMTKNFANLDDVADEINPSREEGENG